MSAAGESAVAPALAPIADLLAAREPRAVEAFTEASLSLLDGGLLSIDERERIGDAIEALDPTPGKRFSRLWEGWITRWYSTSGERRP